MYTSKEGRVALLTLNEACILLYRILSYRIESCLGQHLVFEIGCLDAQLLDECLLSSL